MDWPYYSPRGLLPYIGGGRNRYRYIWIDKDKRSIGTAITSRTYKVTSTEDSFSIYLLGIKVDED